MTATVGETVKVISDVYIPLEMYTSMYAEHACLLPQPEANGGNTDVYICNDPNVYIRVPS
jgi:hypothetical protein